MATKFTYLIGAGASCGVIPTVENFSKGLNDFITETIFDISLPNKPFDAPFDRIKSTQYDAKSEFIDDMQWLIKEMENHSSIDTFARKLYLTHGKAPLRKLKAVVDIYLTLIQLFDGTDLRYDTFFATILNGGMGQEVTLPPNMRVLSWNYDFQFELSASVFFRTQNIQSAVEILHVHPGNKLRSNVNDRFSIFKLNGTAGAYTATDVGFQRLLFDTKTAKDKLTEDDKKNLLVYMMACYKLYTMPGSDTTSTINYAWENNDVDYVNRTVRYLAKEATIDTTHLVVIGYSFPTFNRSIDREILQNMNGLEKVYIQVLEKDMEAITQRFKAVRPGIEPIAIPIKQDANPASSEFFIPFEF